jgi:hypothetical protein
MAHKLRARSSIVGGTNGDAILAAARVIVENATPNNPADVERHITVIYQIAASLPYAKDVPSSRMFVALMGLLDNFGNQIKDVTP